MTTEHPENNAQKEVLVMYWYPGRIRDVVS